MQAAASRDRSTSGAVDDDFDICLAAYKRQRGKAQRGASAQRLLLPHSKEVPIPSAYLLLDVTSLGRWPKRRTTLTQSN